MTIGNSASRLSQDSYRLMLSAPWDIDTGTLGWKFYASPSVVYWETVSRNRRNNEEFRGTLGQVGGIAQYQRPLSLIRRPVSSCFLSELILLSGIFKDSAWNWNENNKTSEDNIMKEECNSRWHVLQKLCLVFWHIGVRLSRLLAMK